MSFGKVLRFPAFKYLCNCPLLFNRRPISREYSDILAHPDVQTFLSLLTKNQHVTEGKPNLVQLLSQRKHFENEINTLSSMDEKNEEMLKLIEEEQKSLVASISNLDEQILYELLPDDNENRDVAVEVSAGVGGKEAMHFAGELFEMYGRYSLLKNWDWECQEMEIPDSGGIRHASAYVSGIGAAKCLIQESGVHRVQRVPATEKSGRVHTSTVTVAVLPQPTDIELVINDKDLKIETKTSSGAGGQHVNKTESCVRITHIPSGIVIENQTDRSQIRNKKLAMQRLRSKLYQMEIDGFQAKVQSSRKEQMGSSMRSEKIRTYNFNQDRVTDHRIGVSVHDLPRFLRGGTELDELIAKLINYNQSQELLKIIQDQLRGFKVR